MATMKTGEQAKSTKAGGALLALEQAFEQACEEVKDALDRAARSARDAEKAAKERDEAVLARKVLEAARGETEIERDRLLENEAAARAEAEMLRADAARLLPDLEKLQMELAKAKADLAAKDAEQAPLRAEVEALAKARREAEETARKMLGDRAGLDSRVQASEEINTRLERRTAELEMVAKAAAEERAAALKERDEFKAGATAREQELRAFFARTLTRKGAEKLASHAMPAVHVKKVLDELIASGKLPAGGLFGGVFQ